MLCDGIYPSIDEQQSDVAVSGGMSLSLRSFLSNSPFFKSLVVSGVRPRNSRTCGGTWEKRTDIDICLERQEKAKAGKAVNRASRSTEEQWLLTQT
jgi:hypothetical protein